MASLKEELKTPQEYVDIADKIMFYLLRIVLNDFNEEDNERNINSDNIVFHMDFPLVHVHENDIRIATYNVNRATMSFFFTTVKTAGFDSNWNKQRAREILEEIHNMDKKTLYRLKGRFVREN